MSATRRLSPVSSTLALRASCCPMHPSPACSATGKEKRTRVPSVVKILSGLVIRARKEIETHLTTIACEFQPLMLVHVF